MSAPASSGAVATASRPRAYQAGSKLTDLLVAKLRQSSFSLPHYLDPLVDDAKLDDALLNQRAVAEQLDGLCVLPQHTTLVRSQGDCLVDSLWVQQHRTKHSDKLPPKRERLTAARKLREDIAQWLRNNQGFQVMVGGHPLPLRAQAEAFMQYPSWVDMCDDVAKDGTWLENAALQAAACVLGHDVIVLNTMINGVFRFYASGDDSKPSAEEALYLGNWAMLHYVPMHFAPPQVGSQPVAKKNNRDDFPENVKRQVRDACGGRCCNPTCGIATRRKAKTKPFIEYGHCGHIAAAAPGGPRYDANQTPAERSSADNAIWLCGTCERTVDEDHKHYTVAVLKQWKADADAAILAGQEANHWKLTQATAVMQQDSSEDDEDEEDDEGGDDAMVATRRHDHMVSAMVDALAVQTLQECSFRWTGWMSDSTPTAQQLLDLRKFTSEAGASYGPAVHRELLTLLSNLSSYVQKWKRPEQKRAGLELLSLVLDSDAETLTTVAEVVFNIWRTLDLEADSLSLCFVNTTVVVLLNCRERARKLGLNTIQRDIEKRMLCKIIKDMKRKLPEGSTLPEDWISLVMQRLENGRQGGFDQEASILQLPRFLGLQLTWYA